MPRGLADPAQRDPRNFTLAEWQQAKRAGQDPRATKGAIQDAWAISDTREALENALKERGYWLAKGDRRGHVVVDHNGEVHSLPRALGKKAKEVRERLGDPEKFTDITETKRAIGETMTPIMKKHIDHTKDMFERRKAAFDKKRHAMRDAHRDARQKLLESQRVRSETEAIARAKKLPKGFLGLWSRITGKYRVLKKDNEAHAHQCVERDRGERNKITAKQLSERRTLQVKIKAQRDRQADLLRELRTDTKRFSKMEKVSAFQRDLAIVRGPSRER